MNKKGTAIAMTGAILLVAVIVTTWRPTTRDGRATAPTKPAMDGSRPQARPPVFATDAPRIRPPEPEDSRNLTAAEKAARVEKIKRDYDEIRAKTTADYGAAGAAFPGGLHAYLRQLALLEREKRADLATVLSPRELEDLELRETTAGQTVAKLLGPTSATEEQRRAVFRLQRDYEDRFALSFDRTPRALVERERARQQLQDQVRTELGDDLFGRWLSGEGQDYALTVAFAARYGLPPQLPLELRRAKNEFTLQNLELNAKRGLPTEQLRAAQMALAQQIEARVMAIVGPGLFQTARGELLGWLPKR